jgi:ankyrin repeat protein
MSSTPISDNASFVQTFEALQRMDVARVRQLVSDHPELLNAQGHNGNTLLNLAVSLAGPICGSLPAQADEIFELLTRPGADVNLGNVHGWTPLHQAAYTNRPELVEWLLGVGAVPDAEARGEGGTPLAVALFWGHREAADTLATRAVVPRNLRVAAGLGRLDLVTSQFGANGDLKPEAFSGRQFYRPHSGFPVWQPSNNRQEVLDEALVWACKSDRVEVLTELATRGARLDADPYRGTPLIWASACKRVNAARWLLDHGADVNQRATFGGLQHGSGVTALHMAAENGHLPMLELLLNRGADTSITDQLYQGSPAGWAEHHGNTDALAYLRSRS